MAFIERERKCASATTFVEMARDVERLTAELAADPARFRSRALWFSKLAFFALPATALWLASCIGLIVGAAVLAVMTGGAVLAVSVLVVILASLTIASIVRSMRFSRDAAPGVQLTARDAPELFAAIDDVRRRVGAPQVDRVYIAPELNAALGQRPKHGVFGGFQSELIIGLPLLQALSVDEFKSVVGHEFGHLMGNDGQAWLWSQRALFVWSSFEANAGNSLLDLPVSGLRRIFWRRVSVTSHVLSRHSEFLADQVAARAVGAPVAAMAMARIAIAEACETRIYQDIWHRAANDRLPQPFHILDQRLATAALEPDAAQVLDRVLAAQTSLIDTHPTTSDRLRALNAPAELPLPIKHLAATLLGAQRKELVKTFDAQWAGANAADWRACQAAHAVDLARHRLLEASAGLLSIRDGALLKTELYLREGNSGDAIAIARAVLDDNPDDDLARFALVQGLIAAATPDEAWIHYADVAARHASAMASFIEFQSQRLWIKGDLVASEAHLNERLTPEVEAAFHTAQASERQLRAEKPVLPTLLLPDEINTTIARLGLLPWIDRAFFVRQPTLQWLQVPALRLVILPREPDLTTTRLEKLAESARAACNETMPSLLCDIVVATDYTDEIALLAEQMWAVWIIGQPHDAREHRRVA